MENDKKKIAFFVQKGEKSVLKSSLLTKLKENDIIDCNLQGYASTMPSAKYLRQYHTIHAVGCLYINIKFWKKEEMIDGLCLDCWYALYG